MWSHSGLTMIKIFKQSMSMLIRFNWLRVIKASAGLQKETSNAMPDMFQTLSYRGPHHSTCSLGYMETSMENFKAVLILRVDISKVRALALTKQHKRSWKLTSKMEKCDSLKVNPGPPLICHF